MAFLSRIIKHTTRSMSLLVHARVLHASHIERLVSVYRFNSPDLRRPRNTSSPYICQLVLDDIQVLPEIDLSDDMEDARASVAVATPKYMLGVAVITSEPLLPPSTYDGDEEMDESARQQRAPTVPQGPTVILAHSTFRVRCHGTLHPSQGPHLPSTALSFLLPPELCSRHRRTRLVLGFTPHLEHTLEGQGQARRSLQGHFVGLDTRWLPEKVDFAPAFPHHASRTGCGDDNDGRASVPLVDWVGVVKAALCAAAATSISTGPNGSEAGSVDGDDDMGVYVGQSRGQGSTLAIGDDGVEAGAPKCDVYVLPVCLGVGTTRIQATMPPFMAGPAGLQRYFQGKAVVDGQGTIGLRGRVSSLPLSIATTLAQSPKPLSLHGARRARQRDAAMASAACVLPAELCSEGRSEVVTGLCACPLCGRTAPCATLSTLNSHLQQLHGYTLARSRGSAGVGTSALSPPGVLYRLRACGGRVGRLAQSPTTAKTGVGSSSSSVSVLDDDDEGREGGIAVIVISEEEEEEVLGSIPSAEGNLAAWLADRSHPIIGARFVAHDHNTTGMSEVFVWRRDPHVPPHLRLGHPSLQMPLHTATGAKSTAAGTTAATGTAGTGATAGTATATGATATAGATAGTVGTGTGAVSGASRRVPHGQPPVVDLSKAALESRATPASRSTPQAKGKVGASVSSNAALTARQAERNAQLAVDWAERAQLEKALAAAAAAHAALLTQFTRPRIVMTPFTPSTGPTFFHSQTAVVVSQDEMKLDSDTDLAWTRQYLTEGDDRWLNACVGVNANTRAFMSLWNVYARAHPPCARSQTFETCEKFAMEQRETLRAEGLVRAFLCHLAVLWDHSLIGVETMCRCLRIVGGLSVPEIDYEVPHVAMAYQRRGGDDQDGDDGNLDGDEEGSSESDPEPSSPVASDDSEEEEEEGSVSGNEEVDGEMHAAASQSPVATGDDEDGEEGDGEELSGGVEEEVGAARSQSKSKLTLHSHAVSESADADNDGGSGSGTTSGGEEEDSPTGSGTSADAGGDGDNAVKEQDSASASGNEDGNEA